MVGKRNSDRRPKGNRDGKLEERIRKEGLTLHPRPVTNLAVCPPSRKVTRSDNFSLHLEKFQVDTWKKAKKPRRVNKGEKSKVRRRQKAERKGKARRKVCCLYRTCYNSNC